MKYRISHFDDCRRCHGPRYDNANYRFRHIDAESPAFIPQTRISVYISHNMKVEIGPASRQAVESGYTYAEHLLKSLNPQLYRMRIESRASARVGAIGPPRARNILESAEVGGNVLKPNDIILFVFRLCLRRGPPNWRCDVCRRPFARQKSNPSTEALYRLSRMPLSLSLSSLFLLPLPFFSVSFSLFYCIVQGSYQFRLTPRFFHPFSHSLSLCFPFSFFRFQQIRPKRIAFAERIQCFDTLQQKYRREQ